MPIWGCAGEGTAADGQGEEIISYCAKEAGKENRIYFNYPQFSESVVNAQEMNRLITDFVSITLDRSDEAAFKGNMKDTPEPWEWNEEEYSLLAMDIRYRITRNDANYLSVVFEGDYHHKNAAHPMKYFSSLTIDVKKLEPVSLADLYDVNLDFVKILGEKFREQIRQGLADKAGVSAEEVAEWVEEALPDDDKLLLESLQQSRFHCFLTQEGLGISVPLGHVMGDHFEVMLGYAELQQFCSVNRKNLAPETGNALRCPFQAGIYTMEMKRKPHGYHKCVSRFAKRICAVDII